VESIGGTVVEESKMASCDICIVDPEKDKKVITNMKKLKNPP